MSPSFPDAVAAIFVERFHRQPDFIVRAPGRVNLIGEHTDYNGGFVLPMAIDRAIWVAVTARDDRHVVIHSADYDLRAEFSLDSLVCRDDGGPGWFEYPKGVAWALQQAGYSLRGWDGVISGDVPQGAGLSSSAAAEIATLCCFAAVSAFSLDPVERARLGQKAENDWVGMRCGIMDQLISSCGEAGHALLIDCRTLEYSPAPLPEGTAVVILDTMTRRGLVESAYNERRAQCEEACRIFGVELLRDVSVQRFAAEDRCLPDIIRRRARHVVSENARTLSMAAAMRQGDVQRMGALMDESHLSLRDDFDVSSDALNVMVESARSHPACWGARMTGAGFGGCAVALIRVDAGEGFVQAVAERYRQLTDRTPSVWVCAASEGGRSWRWPHGRE